MAQRRMISKSISTSTKLAEVGTFSKLLFTWLVPHCDDYGHMDGAARLVKGIVVPLCDEGINDVENSLKELEKIGLIRRYEVDGRQYLEVGKWEKHQTLKVDRPLNIRYPLPPDWKKMDSKRNTEGSKRKSKLREDKISEVKLREERKEASLDYLSNIPKEDMKTFTSRFLATERQIMSKAEDLKLYCERKGRVYKNYQSFLLNALKRDFQERETAKLGKYANV
jgi:hypothetical protein